MERGFLFAGTLREYLLVYLMFLHIDDVWIITDFKKRVIIPSASTSIDAHSNQLIIAAFTSQYVIKQYKKAHNGQPKRMTTGKKQEKNAAPYITKPKQILHG